METGISSKELQAITALLHLEGGGVPNFLRLLGKSPPSMNAFVKAQAALAEGKLTPQQREQIALAVAEINGSGYCLAVHARSARAVGLSEQTIQMSQKAMANDVKTQAMLHFVQAIVLQRGEISDRDFTAMRNTGFSDQEIIEVLANVVLNIFTNYFNLLAQTDLDSTPSPVSRHSQPLRRGAPDASTPTTMPA
ncbi:MAG: carboxymuconolactone decarboxylase family protein [Verrucomicrobiota bacterium]|jgi:uncharacterized peroxidase-related enzyme